MKIFLCRVCKYKYIIQRRKIFYINHSLHIKQKYIGQQRNCCKLFKALRRVKIWIDCNFL